MNTLRPLALLLAMTTAAACGPVGAIVIPDDGSGIGTDTDGDIDGDTDTDTDSDTDGDTDTDPLPDPVYGEWVGERVIRIGRCRETLEEKGVLIEGRELEQACPDCELFYEVEVSPDFVCGLGVRTPTLRGVSFGRDAAVYTIEQTDRGYAAEELAEGDFERSDELIEIEYEYDGEVGRTEFEVQGQAALIRTN